jgi:hypothetical protein
MFPCCNIVAAFDKSGTFVGNGQPAKRISNHGTPTTNAANATSAPTARRRRVIMDLQESGLWHLLSRLLSLTTGTQEAPRTHTPPALLR